MTRRDAERLTHQTDTLQALGFTREEAEALRRISMTLHRWAEAECNGEIERDGDDGDGRPFRSYPNAGRHKVYAIPDRERGAMKRLKAIVNARNDRKTIETDLVWPYVQGDPRGAMLYILRPGDVPEGKDAGSYYTRGIGVY